MRKPLIVFLWLFLLMFVVASVYMSFSSYVYDRETKILANVSTFFVGVREGVEKINIPYPKYTVLLYRKDPQGKFVSSNTLSPEEKSSYIQMEIPISEGTLFMYVRKVEIGEYLSFVSGNAFYTGLLIVSILLYITIFYFTLKEFEVGQKGILSEELVNRLKALRLTIATLKVIPEESIEEMKRLVDTILKDKLSKR